MSRSKVTRTLWLVALAALMVWVASPVARAGDYTWNNMDGDSLWTNEMNWEEASGYPGPFDTANFTGTALTTGGDVYLNGDQQVDAIVFDDQVSGDKGFAIRGSAGTDQLVTNTLDHGVTVGVHGSVTNEIGSMLQGSGGGGGVGLVMTIKSGNLRISGQIGEIGAETELTGSVVGGGTSAARLDLANPDNQMTGTLEIQGNGTVNAAIGGVLGNTTVQLNGGRLNLASASWVVSPGLEADFYKSNFGGKGAAIMTTLGAAGWTATPDFSCDVPYVDMPEGAGGVDGNPFAAFIDPFQVDNISARVRGFLYIATEGEYRLHTASDDGSIIWVKDDVNGAGNWVIACNNDDWQGYPGNNNLFNGNPIHLTQGYHQFAAGFYEGGGGAGWDIRWDAGTGTDFWGSAAPSTMTSVLFHGGYQFNGAYGNDVEVLSTGTIDADGEIAMGKLTANAAAPPAVLNVTGVTHIGYENKLTFTGTRLLSDLTVSNAVEVPVYLGVMDDGGVARILHKQGPGTVHVNGGPDGLVAGSNLRAEDGTLNVLAGAADAATLTVDGGVLSLEDVAVNAPIPGWTTSGYSLQGWPGSLSAMAALTPKDRVYGVDQTADTWGGDGERRLDLGWTGYDNDFCMLWNGTLHITTGGDYRFDMDSDDEGRYWIEGYAEEDRGSGNPTYTLAAGDYDIMTGFHEGGGGSGIWFNMWGPDTGGAWVRTGSVAGSITTIAPTQVSYFGNPVVLASGPAVISVKGGAEMGLLTFNAGVSQLNVLDGGASNSPVGTQFLSFTGTVYQNSITVNTAIRMDPGGLDDSGAGGPVTLTKQGGGSLDVTDFTPTSVANSTFRVEDGSLDIRAGSIGTQKIELAGGNLGLKERTVPGYVLGGLGGNYYTPRGGSGDTGVKDMFNSGNWGNLVGTRIDPVIHFNCDEGFGWAGWPSVPGVNWDDVSAKWEGKVKIDLAGAVTFWTASDDGTCLWIDLNDDGDFLDASELVVDNDGPQGLNWLSGVANFAAAGEYNMLLGYFESGGGDNCLFTWGVGGVGGHGQIVPADHLSALLSIGVQNFGSPVDLLSDSSISVNGGADMGKLSILGGAGVELAVTKDGTGVSATRLAFARTGYTDDWTLRTTDVPVYLGKLDDSGVDPTITVTGTGLAVADNTASQNNAGATTFQVEDGTMALVGTAGGFDPAGSPGLAPPDSGPFAVVDLRDLGNLAVSSKAGTAALGSDIIATAGNSTLSARKVASGAAGLAVDLNGDITVAADAHLLVYLEDNYALRSNGNVDGGGTAAVGFTANFDGYTAGDQMHGVDGWKGWDNNAGGGALVSNAQASSAPNSVEITGASDLVHEFDITGGRWTFSAKQYIPEDFLGQTWFILLSQYADGGPDEWAVQTTFDSTTGKVASYEHGASMDYVTGAWTELKFVIDLDGNRVEEYYDGTLLASYVWSDSGQNTLQAIDLYANGASPVYYDDISIIAQPSTLEIDSGDLLALNGTSSGELTVDIDKTVSRPTGAVSAAVGALENWTTSMYTNWTPGARVNATSVTGIGTDWTVNIGGDAILDMQAVGGQMAATTNVKTVGTLKGDLTNATYGAGGNVVFEQDAILVNQTPGGANLPTRAQLGGALLLNGVTNMAGAYTAGDDAAAGVPDAIFNGVAFSKHFSPGAAFTGTLTVDPDAPSMQIALRDDQTFGSAATAATLTGAGKFVDITGPGKMTVAGPSKGLGGSVAAYNRYGYDEDTMRGVLDTAANTVGHTHNLYILDLAAANVIKYYKHMNVWDGLINITNAGALVDEYYDMGSGEYIPGSEGVMNINEGATLWTTDWQMRPLSGVYNVNAGGAVKVRNWNHVNYSEGPPEVLESVTSTVNDPGATWNWQDGAWVVLEDDDFYWSLAGLPNDVALNFITSDVTRFHGGVPMGDGSIYTTPFDDSGRVEPTARSPEGFAACAFYEEQPGVSETMRFASPQNPTGGERWNFIDTNVTFGSNAVTGDDLLINDVASNKYWLPRNQWRADFEQKSMTGIVCFLDGRYDLRNVTVMGGRLAIGHPWGDDRPNLDVRGITGEITVNEDARLEIRGFRPAVAMPDDYRLTKVFLDGLGTGISVENGGVSQFWTRTPSGTHTLNTGVTFLGGNPDKRAEFDLDQESGNEWNVQMILPDVLVKDGARFTINHQEYNCEGYWPWEHDNIVVGQGVVADLAMEGDGWLDNGSSWRWGLNIRDITDTTPETPSELFASGRRIKLTGTLDVDVRVAEGESTEGIWLMGAWSNAGSGLAPQLDLNGHTVTILSRDRNAGGKDDGSEDYLWAGDPGTGTIDITDPGEGWLLLANGQEQKLVDSGIDPALGWGDNVTINVGGERMLRPNSRQADAGGDLWENIFNGRVNVQHTEGANYDATLFAGWWGNNGNALAKLSDVHLPQDSITKIGRDNWWNPVQQQTNDKGLEYRVNLTLDGAYAIVEGYDWWGDDSSGILNDITGQPDGSTLLLRISDDGNPNRYHQLGGTLTDVTIEAQERLIQFVAGLNLNGCTVNINSQGRWDESSIWTDPGEGTINYRGGIGGAWGVMGVYGPQPRVSPTTGNGVVEVRWGEDTTITIGDAMYMFLNVAGDAAPGDVYTNTFAGPVVIQKATYTRNDWGIQYDAELTGQNWWYGNTNNNNDQGLKIMRWENIQPDQDTGTRLNQWSDGVYMMADFNLTSDYAWTMMCDAGDDWRPVHQRRYFLEKVDDPSGDGRTLRVIGGSLLITTQVTGGANLELEGRWGNPRFGKDVLGQGFSMDAASSTTIIRGTDWDNGYGGSNYPFVLPSDLDTVTDGKFRLVGFDDAGTRRGGNLEIQRGFDGTVDGLLAAVEVDIYNGRALGATVARTDGPALTNVIDAPVTINPDTDSGTIDGVLYARHDGTTTGANIGTVRYTEVTMQDAGAGNVGTVQLVPNGGGLPAKLQIGNTPGDGSGLFMVGDTEVKGGSSDVTIVDVTDPLYHELNLTAATGVQLAGTVQASNVNLTGTARMVEGADADITGQFKVGMGATLELAPTTSITPEMDVENTGLVHAMSGETDLGAGVITGVAVPPYVGGLWAGPVAGDFNTTDPNPNQEVQLGTVMADQTAHPPWAEHTTWVYTGEILVNDTNLDGTGTIAFAENFDDAVLLVIDGTTYINNGTWNQPTISDQMGAGDPNGHITLTAGWYDFEARFGQGGGGVGPVDGWPFGFGYMADASTYVKPDPITSAGFVAPRDPGDMSLFRAEAPAGANITVDAPATLRLGGFTNAGAVTVNGLLALAHDAVTSDTKSLSIDATGGAQFDINRGQLIVDYEEGSNPKAQIEAWITTGFNDYSWDGPGIMSTEAHNDTDQYRCVGWIDNAEYGYEEFPPGFSTPTDPTTVLVAFTLYGDADLNLTVNFDDYYQWQAGYDDAQAGNPDGYFGWLYGEFDYNGVVNFDDYYLWQAGYDFIQGGGVLGAGGGEAGGLSAIPEPATLALMAAGLAAMALKRRKSL